MWNRGDLAKVFGPSQGPNPQSGSVILSGTYTWRWDVMTGKQLSLTMVSNSVVRRPVSRDRPAILTFFARLLPPADPVRSRLRDAQASLDKAFSQLKHDS